MASYWSKRRRVIRTVRDMEKDILKEYEETLYNNKSHLDPCVNREPPFRISHVSQLDTPPASHVHMENDHTDGSVAGDDEVESDHVQMVNDHTNGNVAGNVESDSDSDSHDEHQPSQDLLMRSLRYWATSYSISLVALSALLSILKLSHPIGSLMMEELCLEHNMMLQPLKCKVASTTILDWCKGYFHD